MSSSQAARKVNQTEKILRVWWFLCKQHVSDWWTPDFEVIWARMKDGKWVKEFFWEKKQNGEWNSKTLTLFSSK